jgi:hypothetical protein
MPGPQQHRIVIPYFPPAWKYSTPVLLYGAYKVYTLGYPIWTLVLIIFTAMIFTSKYVTLIDNDKKICLDYLTILFIKFNKEAKKYQAIDRVVITKGRYVKQLNSRISSRTLKWEDYTGTLLFDDNSTLELLTHDDPKKLIESIRVIAAMLNVGIEDRTRREYRWL